MGHQRLGEIPKTKKWKSVVAMIAGSGKGGSQGKSISTPVASVSEVASEILNAAEGGFIEVKTDSGFCHTLYLLTQLVLAARQDDWQTRLSDLGITLGTDATVFDLTGELHRAIEQYRQKHRGSVTIGEMAQQAAGEALTYLAKDAAITLFGTGRNELQTAIKRLSTKAGFSDLAQRFFGNFTARYLDFYISKILPKQAGRKGFESAGDFNDFKQALFDHCHQSSRIVHDFCGQWYSKTEWERGIDQHNITGLVRHAIDKIREELKKQREDVA